MKLFHLPLLCVLLVVGCFISVDSEAQVQEKVYSYSRGEAVDFLFLMQKPDTADRLKDYFSTVFPIAKEAGYRPLPGFRIAQAPTRGNYHPPTLAIASWKDKATRDDAMAKIFQAVPDLQQRRMEIWSSFAMTVYEMPKDVSFTTRSDKVYVLTAHWSAEDESFDRFKKRWRKFAEKQGGQFVLSLEDGESPSGFHYDPDLLTLTEWPDMATFEEFHRRDAAVKQSSVEQVHQFILDVPSTGTR